MKKFRHPKNKDVEVIRSDQQSIKIPTCKSCGTINHTVQPGIYYCPNCSVSTDYYRNDNEYNTAVATDTAGNDNQYQKIKVTKVDNGYVVRTHEETSVIENVDDDVEGLANMLYRLAYEFGGGYRIEINTLKYKHDYLKEDLEVMLKDVHRSYNEDDHDVTPETLEHLEEMFGKFDWRKKNEQENGQQIN